MDDAEIRMGQPGAREHGGRGARGEERPEGNGRFPRPTGEKHLHVYLNLPNYRNNLVRLGWTEEALQEPASDELFDALIAWGDEDAIAGRAREHLDAGADHVALQPLTTEPQKPYREEIERLATVIRELN